MKRKNVFFKAGILLLSLLLLPGLSGCGAISNLVATPTPTPTSTPTPVLGIDHPIIIADVPCDVGGMTFIGDIQFRFIEVLIREHSGNEYPQDPNNVFVDLAIEVGGASCSLNWATLNSVLVCNDVENRPTAQVVAVGANSRASFYIRFEVPKDTNFQECSIHTEEFVVPLNLLQR